MSPEESPPTHPCRHLQGTVFSPPSHTTSYQPIWLCQQCGASMPLYVLAELWAAELQDLRAALESLSLVTKALTAYETRNDGR